MAETVSFEKLIEKWREELPTGPFARMDEAREDAAFRRCADELEAALPAILADLAKLHEAAALEKAAIFLNAIGGMPDGFCVCFNSIRDPLKPEFEHTGECRNARAFLALLPEAGKLLTERERQVRLEEAELHRKVWLYGEFGHYNTFSAERLAKLRKAK